MFMTDLYQLVLLLVGDESFVYEFLVRSKTCKEVF